MYNMKKFFLILIIGIFIYPVFSQTAPNKYWVTFKDKNNSPFSVAQPLDFLSQRAIDRRNRMNISVTSQDFPVNPWYLDSIVNLGATVLTTSRWHNGATFYTTDTAIVSKIRSLSIVQSVQKTKNAARPAKSERTFEVLPISKNSSHLVPKNEVTGFAKTDNNYSYGYATRQVSMIKGDYLHQMGFSGNGMLIGVLDAGFFHADVLPAFDSLWFHNQIVGYKDFVDVNANIFEESTHGMMVLSIMGGNIPDSLVGTAPKASYLLLRTEDGSSENLIEEDNWVAAIEYADSVGVDVINSSLGYTKFDDTTIVRTYADMTGKKSRASLAATIASRKGMIVCNSAGNSAMQPWHFIGVPADADSILTVGAVDENKGYAYFSSVGPAADGRVKPDVSTMGLGTFVQDVDGFITSGNGTSFSSPVLAGVVTCLWQAFPNKSNFAIMDAIRRSANQYNNPDTLLGYGVPDFQVAYNLLLPFQVPTINTSKTNLMLYPNPIGDNQTLNISFISAERCALTVTFYNNIGELIFQGKLQQVNQGENLIQIPNVNQLTAGVYLVQISSDNFTQTAKFVKRK